MADYYVQGTVSPAICKGASWELDAFLPLLLNGSLELGMLAADIEAGEYEIGDSEAARFGAEAYFQGFEGKLPKDVRDDPRFPDALRRVVAIAEAMSSAERMELDECALSDCRWDGHGNSWYLYFDDGFPELLPYLLQWVLQCYAAEGFPLGPTHFEIEWATTCSKPREGAFSGGACWVYADRIHWSPPGAVTRVLDHMAAGDISAAVNQLNTLFGPLSMQLAKAWFQERQQAHARDTVTLDGLRPIPALLEEK